MTVEAAFS